ncbi:putative protease [Anaerobacterium chartisolvens]|uniref:Putative protease n=1 Tax=Anaerobacterium chartisolvens TaxID=1297424 RepID=A0A369BCK4_9FIRM|nr:U32 family peptidase [Anaerobacterium chartisolvens]RCX18306.1 putative protease [Anaerobacterium chartisolvens]
MDKIELLAPAGEWDAFLAAVENGADAVYLGGPFFNARQSAENFDGSQLKNAVEYAHVRDVKVYMAMNTLISDSELDKALRLAEEAFFTGIDGIIVQDLGFAGLLRRSLPGLKLHASTQMTVYNIHGVRILERLGFKRVVLARELSLEEIRYICQNTCLEVEVFVHGALCICYSGQCLMSSVIGGRSGNRGRCAQPCRLPYSLLKNNDVAAGDGKYILSPKDICLVNELESLVPSGVKCLKIEGRMKSPEYVATVTGIYRKYIDMAQNGKLCMEEGGSLANNEDFRALTQIFNRGGFSQGYLKGRTGYGLMAYQKPKNWGIYLGEVFSYNKESRKIRLRLKEDLSNGDGIEIWNGEDESPGGVVSEISVEGVRRKTAQKGELAELGSVKGRIHKGDKVYKTSDKNLAVKARESFSGRFARKVLLEGKIVIKRDMPLMLQAADKRGNTVQVKGNIPAQTAVNVPLTRERAIEQLSKTGGSPFEFSTLELQLDDGVTLPVSEINAARRKALEEMESLRRVPKHDEMRGEFGDKWDNGVYFPGNSRKKISKLKLAMLFYRILEELDYSSLGIDRIYLPFKYMLNNNAKKVIDACRACGQEVYAWIPPVVRGNWERLIDGGLDRLTGMGVDGVLAGNLGVIELVKKHSPLKVAGDYSLNVFNSMTSWELYSLGCSSVMLSHENTLRQIEGFRNVEGLEREVLVYGRVPLMISEHCPVGSIAGNTGPDSICAGECVKGEYRLRDRMGMEFPVLCDATDCISTIFNSNVLFVPQVLSKIKAAGIAYARLNIIDEEPQRVRELAELFRAEASGLPCTEERYEGIIEDIRKRGYTKGHYFRGV